MSVETWPPVLSEQERDALRSRRPATLTAGERAALITGYRSSLGVDTIRPVSLGGGIERLEVRRERDAPAPAPQWPAPEVACRVANVEECPTGALRLRQTAERAKWRVVVTYARGTWPLAYGKQGGIAESVAVRLAGPDGRRAVATWVCRLDLKNPAWKPDGAFIWPAPNGYRAVALSAGKNGAYTIKDWIEGKAVPVSGSVVREPGQKTEQTADAA
jgi:hypothetical protein